MDEEDTSEMEEEDTSEMEEEKIWGKVEEQTWDGERTNCSPLLSRLLLLSLLAPHPLLSRTNLLFSLSLSSIQHGIVQKKNLN